VRRNHRAVIGLEYFPTYVDISGYHARKVNETTISSSVMFPSMLLAELPKLLSFISARTMILGAFGGGSLKPDMSPMWVHVGWLVKFHHDVHNFASPYLTTNPLSLAFFYYVCNAQLEAKEQTIN
jgi:hypothetical protein